MGLGSVAVMGSAVALRKFPGRDSFFPGKRKKEDGSQCPRASVSRPDLAGNKTQNTVQLHLLLPSSMTQAILNPLQAWSLQGS